MREFNRAGWGVGSAKSARAQRSLLKAMTETLESRRLLAGPSFAFAAPITFQSGGETPTVLLGDMNNDSKPDLVTVGVMTRIAAADISIIPGNGDGTFQTPSQTFSIGGALPADAGYGLQASLGDINRDGKLDIVLVRRDVAAVVIYYGNGNGTVGAATSVPMPGGTFNPNSVTVGDFNNDQWLDVAVGRFDDSRVVIMFGGTSFASTTRAVGLPPGSIVARMQVEDFDVDGVSDIAVTTANGVVVLSQLNQAVPQFSAYTNILGGKGPQATTIGRLRGPNFPPGITLGGADINSTYRIVRLPNPMALSSSYAYEGNDFITGMVSGDFNGDGFDDLIFGQDVLRTATGRSNGDIDILPTTISNGTSAYSMISADLNGDGLLDFIAGSSGRTVKVYLQKVQSLTVTTTADEDNGNAFADNGTGVSLREAVNYARQLGGARTITFAPALGNANAVINFGGTNLTALAGSDITIQNTTGRVTLQGNGTNYAFFVQSGNTLRLRNLTVRGYVASLDDAGGAIYQGTGSSLFIDGVTFTGNSAAVTGGAIFSEAGTQTTIRNSTFTGNAGAALALNATGGSVTLEHNTIAANVRGGLVVLGGTVTLNNNIIANNTVGTDLAVSAGAVAGSNNLIRTGVTAGLTATINADPQLNALAFNGGFAETMSLQGTSPALDAGASLAGVTVDQRGVARPQLAAPDIGAFEARLSDLSVPSVITPDGATWFLLGSVGSNQRIYRQAPGQNSVEVGGLGVALGLQAEGNVVVREANGSVFTRLGSANGVGSDWLFRPSIVAGDGATWFLASTGTGGNFDLYRWSATGSPQFASGNGARLVAVNGYAITQNAGGTVFLRVDSNVGLGSEWIVQSSAIAGDGATWFVGVTTAGVDGPIFRWAVDGNVANSGGVAATLSRESGGTILARQTGGSIFSRLGSASGLGTLWIERTRTTTADGAAWFLGTESTTADQRIYRWASGASAATEIGGLGTALALQNDGQVLVRDSAGVPYVRPGSSNGVGTDWTLLPFSFAADDATWFLGADGPAGQSNIYRWGASQFNFTNGFGTRIGSANGTIVHLNAAGTIFVRVGSAGGLGTGWAQANAATAGDDARWFVAAPAGTTGAIFRWATDAAPQTASAVGLLLNTDPAGFIRSTTLAGSVFHRVGSSTGIGTEWRLITESLVVTTTADENDFTSSANLGAGTSLREALAYAQANPGPDTITFAAGLNGQTIASAFGWNGAADDSTFRVSGDLTLDGGNQITLTAAIGNARRLFASTSGAFTLRNLTISNVDSRGVADGAALWTNGTVVIDNVRFLNNKATNGGALVNFGNVVIGNATFQDNVASDTGGAIENGGTLSINDSLFFQNAAVNGGAINSAGGLAVTRSTFSTNAAGFNGGALRLFGNASVSDSTLSGNTAANGGGGLISHGNTSLTNVTIAFNAALDAGGAQFFEGTATLKHVTIARNAATRSGGGMAVNLASVTLTSTLVAGNTAPDQNDYWGAAPAAGSAGNLMNLSANAAQLGTLASNGGPTQTLSLLPGSPAINAGVVVSGITLDQRGVARVQGSAPDVGAFERAATAAILTSSQVEVASRLAVNFNFSDDASVNFGRSNVTLINQSTLAPVNVGSIVWNQTGTQASLVLSNLLPNGNYRATVGGQSVDFFVLDGDFNRDRVVNFEDLLLLAQNYDTSGRTNAQGDVNYDGVVNFEDLLTIARNYNTSLLVSPAATLATGPETRSRTRRNATGV